MAYYCLKQWPGAHLQHALCKVISLLGWMGSLFLPHQRFMPCELFQNNMPIVLPFSTLLHTGYLQRNIHLFQNGNESEMNLK